MHMLNLKVAHAQLKACKCSIESVQMLNWKHAHAQLKMYVYTCAHVMTLTLAHLQLFWQTCSKQVFCTDMFQSNIFIQTFWLNQKNIRHFGLKATFVSKHLSSNQDFCSDILFWSCIIIQTVWMETSWNKYFLQTF